MKKTVFSATLVIISFTIYLFADIYSLALCHSGPLFVAFSDDTYKTVVDDHFQQFAEKSKLTLTVEAIAQKKKALKNAMVDDSQTSPEVLIMKAEFDLLIKEKIARNLGLSKTANLVSVFLIGFMLDFILFFLILMIFIKKKNKGGYSLSGRRRNYSSVLFLAPALGTFVILSAVVFRNVDSFSHTFISLLLIFCFSGLLLAFKYFISSLLVEPLFKRLFCLLKYLKIALDKWSYNRVVKNFEGLAKGMDLLKELSEQDEVIIISRDNLKTIKVSHDYYAGSNLPSKFDIETISESSYEQFLINLFEDFKNKLTSNFEDRLAEDFRWQASCENFSIADNFFKVTAKKILDDLVPKVHHRSEDSNLFASNIQINALFSNSLTAFRKSLLLANKDIVSNFIDSLRQLLITEMGAERQRLMKVNNLERLPDKFKFSIAKEKTHLLVIEQAPTTRTISYLGDRYRLSFPYLIFIVEFADGAYSCLRLFYAQKGLGDLEDRLLRVNLTNTFDDGGVCMSFSDDSTDSFEKIAERAISCFWQSNFNDEAPDNHEAYSDYENLSSYESWEAASKIDPSFIMKEKLLADVSLSEVLISMLQAREEDTNLSSGSFLVDYEKKIDSWLEMSNSLLSEAFLRAWQKIDVSQFNEEALNKINIAKRKDATEVLNLAVASCNEVILSAQAPYSLLAYMRSVWSSELASCRADLIHGCSVSNYDFLELIRLIKEKQ